METNLKCLQIFEWKAHLSINVYFYAVYFVKFSKELRKFLPKNCQEKKNTMNPPTIFRQTYDVVYFSSQSIDLNEDRKWLAVRR